MSQWCDAKGKVVGVRVPDEVIEAIRKDDKMKGESVGLRIKELLVELYGSESVEACGSSV